MTTSAAAFTISCDVSGVHTVTAVGWPDELDASTPTPTSARRTRAPSRSTARGVSDVDGDDPPDNMSADKVFSFSTDSRRRGRIFEIQGASHTSPYAGQLVSGVPGVITAVRPQSFYMQDATGDGNDATSDAVLVFVGGSTAGLSVGPGRPRQRSRDRVPARRLRARRT